MKRGFHDAPLAAFNGPWRERAFDGTFVVLEETESFALAGARHRITVGVLADHRCVQVFVPAENDHGAPEPMTASTNALLSRRRLQFPEPGGRVRAAFRVRVEAVRTGPRDEK